MEYVLLFFAILAAVTIYGKYKKNKKTIGSSINNLSPIRINESDIIKTAKEFEKNNDYQKAVKLLKQHRFNFEEFRNIELLPIILQQSNQYDEAIQEIQNIVSFIPDYVTKLFSHQNDLTKSSMCYSYYSRILKRLAIISKWENNVNINLYAEWMSTASSFLNAKYGNLSWVENYYDSDFWNLKENNNDFQAIVSIFLMQNDINILSDSLSAFFKANIKIKFPVFKQNSLFIEDRDYIDRISFLSNSGKMFLNKAYEYWRIKDYDNARLMFQKVGFTIKTIETEYKKDRINNYKQTIIKIQSGFAKEDPLYKKILPEIHDLLLKNDNVIQSKVYGKLPFKKEDIQYVLYYADQLGDIKRTKKGRSYLLNLPWNNLLK